MPRSPLPTISLCLACSSSLPPRMTKRDLFYTQCCSRLICPNCISSNPRLTRYNPCLRCLDGVKAVNVSTSATSHWEGAQSVRVNVDGSMRDEDVFIVDDGSDDDEDYESDAEEEPGGGPGASTPSPEVPRAPLQQHFDSVSPLSSRPGSLRSVQNPPSICSASETDSIGELKSAPGMPPRYFIHSDDTLLGISLKLGIDSRILCRLNGLPITTLRTTPHLLHTRAFLVLPPSAPPPPPLTPEQKAADEERRARLALERAETRFQAMTKETDRSVAKAYVALAGLPEEDDAAAKEAVLFAEKDKENGLRQRRVRAGPVPGEPGGSSLEGRATDNYFDDGDWEARERAEGRKAALPAFPYFQGCERAAGKIPEGEPKSWWRW
ncbi:uncharacterized protein BXZ73DRAFT_96255 [Epithele typhae]|uniref:uncharacterized protein n=1 Tax=Epithele typhae TaxID=378194 RepID=UPI00200738CA|nr:uncharacterized protein BXZ73DRAFT_96255 [Epithele typhae]KAH9945268.1 hypothetical protein BXZ73DRAFT_96255 [Epithele typhae]